MTKLHALLAPLALLTLPAAAAQAQTADTGRVADAAYCVGMAAMAETLAADHDKTYQWLQTNRTTADTTVYNGVLTAYEQMQQTLNRAKETIADSCGSLPLTREEYAMVCARPLRGKDVSKTEFCQGFRWD